VVGCFYLQVLNKERQDLIRFFVKPADITDDTVRLSAEDSAHIRSLRIRPTEMFIVCDGNGNDHMCRLGDVKGDHTIAEIIETQPSWGEPSVSCRVYIAYCSGDRLDYAVGKSVELGACEIILYPSHRCEAVPRDAAKRRARLQRIALESAKQCGRGIVPMVSAAGSFQEAIESAANADLPLFLYECEEELHLKQALTRYFSGLGDASPHPDALSVVTGPVGGFEPFEAELARAAGLVTVTLGARILRCETAPAAALAAIMYHTDNL